MGTQTQKRRKKGGGVPPVASLFALLFFLGALLYYRLPSYLEAETEQTVSGDGLTVYFLDVGQGDSALLLSGGQSVLIDGGPRSAAESLCADLDALGVEKLDYLIATHPHEDHIGGLPDVLETRTVEQCWMPDDVADSQIYETFLEDLDAYQVSVTVPEVGDSFTFGDCTVTVLCPIQPAEDHNNNSLVLRVTCGETTFLFTGDMEAQEEADLLASGADLTADVLKVPHHGSAYTTSEAFLQAVQPSVAVISCGAGNSYGHPHEELLQRLETLDLSVYRTDLQGEIVVSTDGTEITVSTEREVTQ